MENNEKKFFTKFDDSINKEKIFIRLMKYNYKILCQKWYENPVKAKKLEQERDEFYREAKEMGKEYLEYLKYSLKEVLEQDIKLKKVESEENKQLLKENKFLKKYYAFWINYYANEFDYLLKAHVSFIKNGEVVPFDEFDEDVKEHVSFECGFDIYLNLSQFHFLGHTLALNDVVNQKRRFLVLLLNFILGTLMILLPLTALTTLQGEDIIYSFGVWKSDLYLESGQEERYLPKMAIS